MSETAKLLHPELTNADVDATFDSLQETLYEILRTTKNAGYASKFEVLGILEYKLTQLKKALSEEHLGVKPTKIELIEIAETCILAMASIKAGFIK